MIKEAIQKIIERVNLTQQEASDVMTEIMTGKATDAQIAAFITALRMKGETVEEITGCAKVMRQQATKITVHMQNQEWNMVVDTCGTGGDKTKTFNISTASAFVVAGAGVVVAKHGNRAISSKCGSADVLEALGVNIELSPLKVEECINKYGIGFLYAPIMHSAMKYAMPARKDIGVRTIFNILGPLSNPANITAQVLGVYSANLTEPLANVLKNLGLRGAFVVHGMDGTDEFSITTTTQVSELKDGVVRTYTVSPEDFGLKSATIEEIKGGDAKENAQIILDILEGKKGARRDVVLLNSAAALTAAGRTKDILEGIKVAADSIDSGMALKKLEELKMFCKI